MRSESDWICKSVLVASILPLTADDSLYLARQFIIVCKWLVKLLVVIHLNDHLAIKHTDRNVILVNRCEGALLQKTSPRMRATYLGMFRHLPQTLLLWLFIPNSAKNPWSVGLSEKQVSGCVIFRLLAVCPLGTERTPVSFPDYFLIQRLDSLDLTDFFRTTAGERPDLAEYLGCGVPLESLERHLIVILICY